MTSPLNIALLFTVIFAALKFAGVTGMTWLGVFSPMLIWLGILVALIIYFALAAALKKPYRSRSRYDRLW
jgi:hypothetical protein